MGLFCDIHSLHWIALPMIILTVHTHGQRMHGQQPQKTDIYRVRTQSSQYSIDIAGAQISALYITAASHNLHIFKFNSKHSKN